MKATNACDECRKKSATLYEKDRRLICYYCLPDDDLMGRGALRTIKASVTGVVQIECRRRQLLRRR
jgi:hypothetical protein